MRESWSLGSFMLKSFNAVKAQFHLSHHQLWKYLQLSHQLLHNFGSLSKLTLTHKMGVFSEVHKHSLSQCFLSAQTKAHPPLRLTW